MGTKSAEGLRGPRKYVRASYVVITVYITLTAVATYLLWRSRVIHDAASLGAYATVVLAMSTIVLFAATAVLAAATIELGLAERESSRREDEKYDHEKGARQQESRIRDEQLVIFGLQVEELRRKMIAQERAQAELINMTMAIVRVALKSGIARRCHVLRIENRSHMAIHHCEGHIVLADGTIYRARIGTLQGQLSDSQLAQFDEQPETIAIATIRSGSVADFVFLADIGHIGVAEQVFEFNDMSGLRWRNNGQLTRLCQDSRVSGT